MQCDGRKKSNLLNDDVFWAVCLCSDLFEGHYTGGDDGTCDRHGLLIFLLAWVVRLLFLRV